jgi:hypothetical protein
MLPPPSATSAFALRSAAALRLAALALDALAMDVPPRELGAAADAAAATDEPVRIGAEAAGRAGMSQATVRTRQRQPVTVRSKVASGGE